MLEPLSDVPVAEQTILLHTVELENHVVLGTVKDLKVPGTTLTLVRKAVPPWCWPRSEPLFQPAGLHQLALFEDPEERVETVVYPDPWDEEFDRTVEERWRRRGLRCTPGLGVYAGQELSFEYGVDGKCQVITFLGQSHHCQVYHTDEQSGAAFTRKCLEIALRLSSERKWPREALEAAVLVDGSVGSGGLQHVKVAELGDAGDISVHVDKKAAFSELHHIVAVALFRAGHFFEEGFALWTADGSSLLPTGGLKFLQPALEEQADLVFRCVAVPRSAAAVAVAGVGVFRPGEAPARQDGTARVGYCVTAWGGGAQRLPGAKALAELMREQGRPRGGRHAADALPLAELPGPVAGADDLLEMPAPEAGSVLQLFEISGAGIVNTNVRSTSDGNMVGGSYTRMALPAEASSRVVRGLLHVELTRHSNCWDRLATASDNTRSVSFDRLCDFEHLQDQGLCICGADGNER